MLKAILLALNLFCGVYGLWFVGVILLGALKRYSPYPTVAPRKRLAAVIAARNEEAVIAACVGTLRAQKYPRELFDIWVVPNNCTDNTAQAARKAGARVMNCNVPIKCKGDVLAFAFAELLKKEDYDAFCVFDADNLADPGFFQAANDALCSGVNIAQGYRDSKNPADGWIAGGMSLFFWFMNRFFNRGRRALGMSAMLNGTGIVISAELIRKNGWKTFSLTEDLEYTAQCGLLGERIGWMENAVIYDEQPLSLRDSMIQRRRWMAGTLQCLRGYGLKLWGRFFRTGALQAFDFAMFYTGSICQYLGLIAGGFGAAGVCRRLLEAFGWPGPALAALALVLGFCLLSSLAAVALCLLAGGPLRRMLPAILGFGVFLITWMPANLAALVKPRGWRPIAHTSRASLRDLGGRR